LYLAAPASSWMTGKTLRTRRRRRSDGVAALNARNDPLLQPLRLGDIECANRVVMAPMTRQSRRCRGSSDRTARRVLRTTCERRTDRHRRSATVDRRQGLSTYAGFTRTRTSRSVARGHRRRTRTQWADRRPVDARRTHRAPPQQALGRWYGRALCGARQRFFVHRHRRHADLRCTGTFE
jgi:hypothetical protein